MQEVESTKLVLLSIRTPSIDYGVHAHSCCCGGSTNICKYMCLYIQLCYHMLYIYMSLATQSILKPHMYISVIYVGWYIFMFHVLQLTY